MPAFIKVKGATAKRRAAKRRAKEAAYWKACALVNLRDGLRCKVCNHPTRDGHHHHIRPRSLGGPDTTANLIRVCADCHQAIHAKRIRVAGNPNDGTLQITEAP